MFPMYYLIPIILIQFIIPFVQNYCPNRGDIGKVKVPDILGLIKHQSGFSATIEIITPEEDSIMISDNYNGAKKFGQIEVNKLYSETKTNIYYYDSTNEKFSIESDVCTSSKLDLIDKYTAIGTWIVPDEVIDEVSLFGNMEYLGPTNLMIWAKGVSDQAQYVGVENIDGQSVNHWFYCLSDTIWIDFWFDNENDLPFRFSLSQSNSSLSKIGPHVYNYLIFNPVITSTNDIVSYPVGFGCARSVTGLPEFPSFVKSETFSLDMEAMIMYTDPARMILSSVRMMKYQGTYSFEINDSVNATRIIQNPKHRGRYIVDVPSGQCTLDFVEFEDIQEDNLAIRWPFHNDPGFNLLQAVTSTSGAWSYFMGQVDTDAGLMDVWEDGLYSFFSSGYNVDVVVTYYFPVIDRTSKPHQAPVKIVIKPVNIQYISFKAELPYQIEITIIDYDEQSNFEIYDRFDISGCYDGPGQFTWFQMIMSDINPIDDTKDLPEIRTYFEQALTTFIPAIRIPEIVVTSHDFNYYISVKLLERPPFVFNYEPDPKYIIKNPTSILIRDALEDCGELCTNDINCKEFSYCTDLTCQVFSTTTSYSAIELNDECTWYRRRTIDTSSNIFERNILTSTRSILSQIKSKINQGEFVIPKYSLSVEDMFIVSGPEEVGGLEEEVRDQRVNPLKGDEFSVIASSHRLITTTSDQSTINGISYSDCLKLCLNDDDCYTLSYCNDDHKECTLSTETKANLTKGIQDKTSHADKCNVFEKSFVAFYRKFPGQSLVKDSISTLFDVDISECSRICYESIGLSCKSFDYCLQSSTGINGGSSQRACFLHEFHEIEDTTHEINDKIWDFSTSTCDHYAVKLSRDYVHYIGRKYTTDKVTIINEADDISMERCAGDCNSFDDDNCISFEYCESIESRSTTNIKSSCRLSSTLTTGVNDLSSLDTTSTCSVYVNKDRASKRLKSTGSDHFGLAMGLGSFFFVLAFVAGAIGSIYYARKFS